LRCDRNANNLINVSLTPSLWPELPPRRYTAPPTVYGRRMGPTASELRTIPLFHGFEDEELSEIGDLFKPVTPGDKPLFDVGEPATTLYLLTKGEVVLERPGDDTFKLSPPALIGEL